MSDVIFLLIGAALGLSIRVILALLAVAEQYFENKKRDVKWENK